MNINISDDITGEERRKVIEIYPIIYAFYLFGKSNLKVANFLGISRRALTDKLSRHEELRVFLLTNFDRGISPKERFEFKQQSTKDPLEKVFNNHLHRAKKSFWYNQLSSFEKTEFEIRLRKLYNILS